MNNNCKYLTPLGDSAELLVKNLHELSYLQRLNRINNRENKYLNSDFTEYKNKTKKVKNLSIDSKKSIKDFISKQI